MNAFDEQLAIDAANTFLQEFGECITFLPWQDAPVTIRALIDRDEAMGVRGFKGAASYKPQVQISRHCTLGRKTITPGKDKMIFPFRVHSEMKLVTFTVLKPLGPEDAGMWKLEVGQS